MPILRAESYARVEAFDRWRTATVGGPYRPKRKAEPGGTAEKKNGCQAWMIVLRTAQRTRSLTEWHPRRRMMLARWVSTVLTLRPRAEETSLLGLSPALRFWKATFLLLNRAALGKDLLDFCNRKVGPAMPCEGFLEHCGCRGKLLVERESEFGSS
jgi:hypothetical protein